MLNIVVAFTIDMYGNVADLQRAIDGDRKAQYYLSQALAECEYWVSHPSFQNDESFRAEIN